MLYERKKKIYMSVIQLVELAFPCVHLILLDRLTEPYPEFLVERELQCYVADAHQ